MELRWPKDASDEKEARAFLADVVTLAGSGSLKTGDDYYRAASLMRWDGNDFRLARVRYELLLTATARDHPKAQTELTFAWDSLLRWLGRPVRFDTAGWAERNPEAVDLEAAPASIQAVWRDPAAARVTAASAVSNAELQAIVDADQADRKNWDKRTPEQRTAGVIADRARNVRAREIVRAGELHTVADFANASLVMQHSAKFSGYQLAHELAVCAMLLGDRGTGRWLVAAAYDRMLISLGHEQRFGTQSVGGTTVPVDKTGITDLQRQALGCPPLSALRGPRAADIRDELTAPDGWLRDPKVGLEAQLPAGWTISDAQRSDDYTAGAGFKISGKDAVGPRLYYKRYPLVQPNQDGGFEAGLREDARRKALDRVAHIPDYVNRPDSFVFRSINGYPALAWTADYTEGGQKYSEYFVRLIGPKSMALFFMTGPSAEIDTARPAFDGMIATLKLP